MEHDEQEICEMEMKGKYYFIVNQKSQTGKTADVWGALEKLLKERRVEYEAYVTQYFGHAAELAEEICAKPGEKHLVVVGGDGTINEALNGMHDFSHVTFGCIPSGSGNDFARGFGLKGTPQEILDRMLVCREETCLDLGQVTYADGQKRKFIVSSGVGVDADVCRQALDAPIKRVLNRLHLGQLTYVLLTVKTLFSMPLTDAEVTLENGTKRDLKRVIFISAMNFPYEGGGVPMAPRASARDGKLSCCCVYGIPRWLCFCYLPLLCLGKHEKVKGFDIIESSGFTISLKDEMCVHTDGEHCGRWREMEYEILPGKLRVWM